MIKTLYIPAKLKNLNIEPSKSELSKLPKKIFLAYTIQYKDAIPELKNQLTNAGIKITQTQQVLGCSKINTNSPILLLTSGKFHATNLYLQSQDIYMINQDSKISKIPSKDIQNIKTKRKTAYLKFLHADNIGILVSTKPGQEYLNQAIKLKQKLEKQNKQAYIFISNDIDISQFENFKIGSWVNTACSGLAMDNPNIINVDEIH